MVYTYSRTTASQPVVQYSCIRDSVKEKECKYKGTTRFKTYCQDQLKLLVFKAITKHEIPVMYWCTILKYINVITDIEPGYDNKDCLTARGR